MQPTPPFIVYRDRIGAASEISFLRRQYLGFTRLHPIWTGRTILPGASQLPGRKLRLGNPFTRLLFRHLGYAPDIAIRDLAPILHAQFARGGALALPLAKALNHKLVVTLHGGDISKTRNWQRTVLSQRWPALVRYASTFVCVSHAVANLAAARGVPASKLQVLPIGVEIPSQPPATTPKSLLFVGRFVEKKGISILANAIRLLRAQGDATPVVCAGDGPLRPILEALAREQPGITLAGWLSPDETRAQMTQAIALLVPSIIASDGDAEGLPSVIPEAMAQACPVIGSNQGGIAEAIIHGRNGLLVPPGDAQALSEAIRQLTHQRPKLAANAFNDATTNLNAHIQSALLEKLLLGL